MSPDQMALIERSWANTKGKEKELVQTFYEKLLNDNPQYVYMFESDPVEQQKKFLEMITTIINGMRYMDKLIPLLKELGERHEEYGVTGADYAVVANALVWSMGEINDTELSDEEVAAWAQVIQELKAIMQN